MQSTSRGDRCKPDRISRNGRIDADGPVHTAGLVLGRACPLGPGEVNPTEDAGRALKAHARLRRGERGRRSRLHHPINELPFAFVTAKRTSAAHTMKARVYDDADCLTATAHGDDAFMRIGCARCAARDGERTNRAERQNERRCAAHSHSVRRSRRARKPCRNSLAELRGNARRLDLGGRARHCRVDGASQRTKHVDSPRSRPVFSGSEVISPGPRASRRRVTACRDTVMTTEPPSPERHEREEIVGSGTT